MIDGHTAFGLIVGAFVIGMLVMEWSAHWATDLNRADAVAFHDYADQAMAEGNWSPSKIAADDLTLIDLNAMLEDAAKAGCPEPGCPDLTICDECGQFVCSEHTEDVVLCEVSEAPHHDACSNQCDYCSRVRAHDAAVDRMLDERKESRR